MSLFHLLSVSASGMAAQRMRAELLAENLANAETTRTPSGGPYRRKDVVFQSAPQVGAFSSVFEEMAGPMSTGVEAGEVLEDQSPPEQRYMPGHPDADANGYVSFPNVNPAEEMANLMAASRGYQANISSMTVVKDMIHRSLDLMR